MVRKNLPVFGSFLRFDRKRSELGPALITKAGSAPVDYIDNSNITEDSLWIKKIYINFKDESFFPSNSWNYLHNVWLNSDTTGHGSVPIIGKYSLKDNLVEEVKSQTNVSKIPVNYDLQFNSNANDDKQTNTLKNAQIKHPKKVCLSHIL